MEMTLTLNGNDITKDLEPHFISLTYVDKLSGEADTLDLTLADPKKIFLNDMPKRGLSIAVTIAELDAGSFEVDELSYSSPPSTLKIKATSISQNSGLRQVDESKSWEHVKLSKIAKDIADASNCELFYDTDFDPEINRAEQGEQSRLAFLGKICADWGLITTVYDGKLIIYPEESLELRDAACTLKWTDLMHFDARATLQEVYKDCQVNYKHGQHSELYSATATTDKTEGKTLKINKRVNSQAEAEQLAKHELHKKNKHEFEATLTTRFDSRLVAGNSFTLDEFGAFNGRWLIDEATHSIAGNGSITKVKAHKAGATHEQT